MDPQLQKPRITEIQVRMDCNGCVQKIKKALHGINGIYDLYIDFPQQKITIVGWADPEKIVKAIRKTRKSAIICSHTEPPDEPAQTSEQANQQDEAPPSESANPPPPESANSPLPTETPPAEAAPPAEPPKDQQPQQENPKPEAKPSPDAGKASASQPAQPTRPRDFEEVHVIYHHTPDYGYRYGYNHSIGHGYSGQWHSYPSGPGFRPEPPPPPRQPEYSPPPPPPPPPPPRQAEYSPPPPIYVTHSYNTHRPSPYVTGYEYVRIPPQYTQYNPMERYSEDYHHGNNGNGNVTAIFSDENPNACRIV